MERRREHWYSRGRSMQNLLTKSPIHSSLLLHSGRPERVADSLSLQARPGSRRHNQGLAHKYLIHTIPISGMCV
jgi:hypothetical protein